MMIQRLLLLTLGLSGATAWGQMQIDAPLFISAGAVVTVSDGNVSGSAAVQGPGTLSMAGTIPQELNMTGNSVENLEINNVAGILLTGNAAVNGTLSFTNGNMALGASTLSFTTTGVAINYTGTDNKYIITDGLGVVRKEDLAMNTSFTFPIGRAAADYTPATIMNLDPAIRSFSVQVKNNTESMPLEGNTAKSIDRTWQISSNAAGPVNMDLTHNDVTNLAGIGSSGIDFDPAAAYITQQIVDDIWSTSIITADGGTPVNTLSADLIVPGTQDATSYFTKTSALDLPLPLTLKSFDAVKSGKNSVTVSWVSIREKAVSHFEVERSGNGTTFNTISDRVLAKNKETATNYTIQDNSPAKGINYYRLKIVDKDGSYKNSQIRMVNFNDLPNVTLSPNPAVDHLDLTGIFTDASVEIFSMAGQRVYTQQVTGVSARIDITRLVTGTYYIYVSEGEAIKFNRKFMKQ
jgi:hypothetical protein